MIKSRSRYAILGILGISNCTGYDIKKYCDTVISGFWNENFGHIYPTLKALEREGLIRQTPEAGGARSIRYELTEEGTRELLRWLAEETHAQPVRSEFMLKFLFSSRLPRERVMEMLGDYRRRAEEELNAYLLSEKELAQGGVNTPEERARFLRATVRRGILSARASIEWCDETMRDLGV